MAPKTTAKGKDLSKTVFLMTLKKEGKHVAHFFTGGEEDEVPAFFKDGYAPHENFKDMGSPQTITVTIEPGDKLNV